MNIEHIIFCLSEGTESDEEWAARVPDKRTEVRNFRSDIKKEDV